MKVVTDKTKLNRVLCTLTLCLICIFATAVLLQLSSLFYKPTKKTCTKEVCLKKFMEGPPAFNDVSLKNHIMQNYMAQMKGKLTLTGNDGATEGFTSAVKYIKEQFANKRGGTFAVFGAGDGEYLDVTLPLEADLGWTGLLVEPIPSLFELLKAKRRNALLAMACVSPYAYPAQIGFGYKKLQPQDTDVQKLQKRRKSKLTQLWNIPKDQLTEKTCQCIPIENLMYTAGFEKKLDLMVLSMSGTDLDILVNVRMEKMPDIQMIVVFQDGGDVANDISSYFLENNIVLRKVFGEGTDKIYILEKVRI